MKRKFLSILLLFVFLVLPLSLSARNGSNDLPIVYDDGDALTMKKYRKIKNGMSYRQVVKIIGRNGDETFSSVIGKYKTVSYKWEGAGFKFIYATFQNDKLTSKTQANLK